MASKPIGAPIGFHDLPNVPDCEEPGLPLSTAPSLLPPTGTLQGLPKMPGSATPDPPLLSLGPAPLSDIGATVSGNFRKVLEQVVHQYLQDMEDLENRLRVSRESDFHRSKSPHEEEDEDDGLKTPPEAFSPMSSPVVKPRRMSTGQMADEPLTREISKKSGLMGRSSTTAFWVHGKKPRQLQASEVLDAWENQESKVEELFKVDPLQEPEAPRENFLLVQETETTDRLAVRTPMERFQVFLQSSKFDMVSLGSFGKASRKG
ncbi:ycf45 [Symbiodinium natans]|uniref:Ycf45 protein n=1 Tax=Symbiodinium natans TaxID=878477 RepID=A0A812PI54_9DINO|nr:ycf45 [Symbiodinium natans]